MHCTRNFFFVFLIAGCVLIGQNAASQSSQGSNAGAAASSTTQLSARPNDVSTVDGLISAMYDSISGPSTNPRDWNRFRSLFHPGARLIRTAPSQEGFSATVLTPDDYVTRAGKYFETHSFFEREIARKTEAWGNLQQIFSTYESRHEAKDATPFARGINSVLLFNDGKRWWIMTIAWQEESPELKLPEEYLPPKH